MKKNAVVFVILFAFTNAFSQKINSIELNGGLLVPYDGYDGFITGVYFNHHYNETIGLYLSTSYANWGKNVIKKLGHYSLLKTSSEDSHELYSVNVGTRISLTNIKTFTIYTLFEVGYNYLTYNYYKNISVVEPSTNMVVSLFPDFQSKEVKSENMFGFGFGMGFVNKITENVSINVQIERNSITRNLDEIRNNLIIRAGMVFVI